MCSKKPRSSEGAKRTLREELRRRRGQIPVQEREIRARGLLEVLSGEWGHPVLPVMVYVELGSELSMRGVIEHLWGRGVAVALPSITGLGQMEPRLVQGWHDLEAGPHGTRQPRSACVSARPELVLVPGLGFTQDGWRLGQGGGYYDRFLADLPAVRKVGVCFREQVCETLPTEAHDVRMDRVVAV